MKNWRVVILLLVLLISSYIKLFVVNGNNFPFTMDQGRDMVDIRQMVVNHSPRLVGPTTSINGVLLGPFWYYFLLIPFVLFGGSPQAIMIWQIVWYQLSVIFLWWVIEKKNKNLAFLTAFLLLLSPTGFYTGRYFWNANAMPIMTAFFFGMLLLTVQKPKLLNFLFTGLIAGLSMQVEAAFGILFFPFAFIYLAIKNKKIDQLFALFVGFFITLIPQILFEIRHQFIMTKLLLSEFTGKAGILGEKLSFSQRIPDRWKNLIDQVRNLSHIPETYVNIILIVSVLIILFFIIRKTKTILINNTAIISLSFMLFAAFFYMVFSDSLKQWYILGISIPLTLILACAFEYLWMTKNKIAIILVSLILLLHFTNALSAQTEYITGTTLKPSNDPSNLRNQLTAIDWVYREADGKAFKAYDYVPSVYDYSLNYLYWWYGTKTYGYQPSEVAYLPNQPEYIQGNSSLWTKAKPFTEQDPIMLIIELDKEMPSRQQQWEGNFSKLCLGKKLFYPFGTEVQELIPCPVKK